MQEKPIKPNEDIKPKDQMPDEKSGILTQGKIKIFDPRTNEVFVEIRA
jgi:hypothetical protein